jgi:hypothetical protein
MALMLVLRPPYGTDARAAIEPSSVGRLLLDELLDFFRSDHLAARAAQLAYLSEVLLLRQPRRLQVPLTQTTQHRISPLLTLPPHPSPHPSSSPPPPPPPTPLHQVALDVRAPRLVLPTDLRDAASPLIALDMGRLTFTRANSDPYRDPNEELSTATPAEVGNDAELSQDASRSRRPSGGAVSSPPLSLSAVTGLDWTGLDCCRGDVASFGRCLLLAALRHAAAARRW